MLLLFPFSHPKFCVHVGCRTLTAPVEFIKCLKSIKEHAFAASPYPVVVTLEDHLTPELQAKAAQVINLLHISFEMMADSSNQ